MFGVSKYGFKRKTYNDILDELIRKSKDAYGENVNTSSHSILGMFLRVVAWIVAGLWKLAEKVYLSAYVQSAEGVQLDRIAGNIGVVRLGKRHATGFINIYTKELPVEIEKGFIVESPRGQRYRTTEDALIEKQGQAVPVTSLEKGLDTNVEYDTEFKIITPVANVVAVKNAEAILGGRDEETDVEFRERYYQAIEGTGSSTRASIEATLRQLDNVDDAKVHENDTDEYIDNIPPHSIYAIVLGGDEQVIGKAILGTKAAGIGTVGAVEVDIEDEGGLKHKVYYDKGKYKEVDIRLLLQVNRDYSESYEADIHEYIKEHIQTLGLGSTLYQSRIIMSLQEVAGLENIQVYINDKAEDLVPMKNEAIALGSLVIEYVNRV